MQYADRKRETMLSLRHTLSLTLRSDWLFLSRRHSLVAFFWTGADRQTGARGRRHQVPSNREQRGGTLKVLPLDYVAPPPQTSHLTP